MLLRILKKVKKQEISCQMPRYTLKTSFPVEPCYLDQNVKQVVEKKLKENVVGTCDRTRGYIEEVIEIVDYDNYISNATSQVIFVVLYVASCVKPSIGDQVQARVLNISNDGIFCIIYDKCITLIPMTKLHERYSRSITKDGKIENPANKEDFIQVGSVIMVEIINTRYDNKQYSCIALVI